jgi:hypothetical protein
MGANQSTDASAEAVLSAETEHNAIGRQQAITGAKAADTRVKARGPKSTSADHEFIQAGLLYALVWGCVRGCPLRGVTAIPA